MIGTLTPSTMPAVANLSSPTSGQSVKPLPGVIFRLRALLTLLTLGSLAMMPASYAAHPLITEDTRTQGTGNAELQLGFSWTRAGSARSFSFQPQLSYGLLTTMDVIVQPAWLTIQSDSFGTSRGFGDTLLDFKWRFLGDAPFSLAVRAGATFPTGEKDLGLLNGKPSAHALLVTTIDVTPLTIDGNIGYIHIPAARGLRTDLYHVSGAAVFAATKSLSLVADTAFDSNPNAARGTWPGVLLVGAIYTVQAGLDIDVGYQTRLNHAAPAQQWLVGITYRWGP